MLNILTLDGGGQLELTSTLMLEELEMRRPGFLKKVDLIAGTSAGGMVALILATEDDAAALLPQLDELWERFSELTLKMGPQLLLSMFGVGSFYTHDRLREYLGKEDLLGSKTLADLKKQVVITAFELDVHDAETDARKWRPKMFHNFQRPDNADLYESCLDVALRSSAAPIFFPIVDGYIDGGVFANHPAMAAIAELCHDWRKFPDEHTPKENQFLNEMRVLSVGVGEDRRYIEQKDADWGWFSWLLKPSDPFLVIQALLRGDQWAVNFQCKNILPHGSYHRLDPHFVRKSMIPMGANTDLIRETVKADKTQHKIEKTVAWLDKSGWFD